MAETRHARLSSPDSMIEQMGPGSHLAQVGRVTMALDDPVLAEGGELGAMMREFNWDATPLGPPAQWPPALRTCVRIMLTSRQPIWIGWGEELTFLYNDPYKAIIGGKHPEALGRPISVVWRELLSVIEPMLSVAKRGDAGTYVEAQRLIMERYGYEEETYYTFSYSPVRNEHGGTAGIICFNTDDTRRVIGERQMALLKELAARTADARTIQDACALSTVALATERFDVPFALIYLVDPVHGGPTLASSVRLAPGQAAAAPDIWPLMEVARSHAPRVVELGPSLGSLPTGGWHRPPTRAVVLPIGDAGLLVVGLNPFRLFDDSYADFLGLVAGQIAASLRNAKAYQDERERAEALAALDRAKTQFFSNISHEFRTPLTLLLGPAQEALTEPGIVPATRERLAVIHRNALRLLRLVNTLLDYSRIEAGRVQAWFTPTELASYTAELASNFRSAIDRAGLALVVDAPALAEPVYVDRGMWETIVLNLLSNAFKHTFEGAITVGVTERDGNAVLEVRDTGVGIPPDELPHIFERFHRVANTRSRTHEGSGIGLAFVQELVKLHAGSIQAESTLGVGTTLRVTIPMGATHLRDDQIGAAPDARAATHAAAYVEEALRWLPGDGSVAAPAHQPAPDPAGATPPRILVADDNADMREYITRLLTARGWTVEAVENGEAALTAARERRPDAMVTDVMMPGLDGFALLRALRADTRTHRLPIILLSARTGEDARVDSMRAGADDYVVKPFAGRVLVASVAAQLERAREAAAAEAERARLRELFAQAPAAIAVLSGPDHVYEIANEHYLKFVGHRKILGKPIREALPELEGQGIYELLSEVYRTGVPFASTELGVMLDNRGDGVLEERFFNFTYQPLRNSDRTVSGIFVHAIDVTDQARLRQEAMEANAAKSEFLAAMSHELRTPLNAIAGYLQLLGMGVYGSVTDAQRLMIARAERSQAHLLSLINDVLHFAKLEAGRVEYRFDDCSLAEIVTQVMPMIEPQLDAKQIAHAVEIAPCIMVRTDADKLQQILLNLLSNAVKFTNAGGQVTVSAAVVGDRVSIDVTDTGCGIAADKLDVIFDPFVQVHRKLTNTPDGTGLGLAISRDLAHGMGGDLSVRSVEGQGSTFTLTIAASRSVAGPS